MGKPMFTELRDHTVYKNTSGEIVPSITTILSIINKPELIHWANWLGFNKKSVKSQLDIAGTIGTHTHALIEEYTVHNRYAIDPVEALNPVERICVKNAFASFLQFYNKVKHDWVFEQTEMQMSGKRYGGTLDALTRFKGKRTIGDYKTSKAFYPSMFLQIAGYDLLLWETYGIEVEQYMVVLLDKKSGREAQVKICDDPDEMTMYRKCFKELVDFYHSWYYINQSYWNIDLIKKKNEEPVLSM
jgi:hypothetical protein